MTELQEERFNKAWEDGETFLLRTLAKKFIDSLLEEEIESCRISEGIRNCKYDG